jgi:hypothetical protein
MGTSHSDCTPDLEGMLPKDPELDKLVRRRHQLLQTTLRQRLACFLFWKKDVLELLNVSCVCLMQVVNENQ